MSSYPQDDRPDPIPSFEPRRANEAYARKKATELGLDPGRFVAQLRTESGFSSNAFNRRTKAQGIAQYIPSTARQRPGFDPSDAKSSIDFAAEDKRRFVDRFGSEPAAESAHFNGPEKAIAALRNKRGNPKTAAYVGGIDKATRADSKGPDPIPDFTVGPDPIPDFTVAVPVQPPQATTVPGVIDTSRFTNAPRPGPAPRQFNIPSGGFQQSTPQRIAQDVASEKPFTPKKKYQPELRPGEQAENVSPELLRLRAKVLRPALQQSAETAARAASEHNQADYLRSLPVDQRRPAAEKFIERGEHLGDEARSVVDMRMDPRARLGETILAPLKSAAGRIMSGIGAEAETIAPYMGYGNDYHSGLSRIGANVQESGRQSAERGYQGPVARFAQGATSTAAMLPLGISGFVMDSYLESRGQGEDHATALKHAATTAAGIYAGGKVSKTFEAQVEGTVQRYLARSTGLATGLTGASVIAGDPQTAEGLGHTALMSLGFGAHDQIGQQRERISNVQRAVAEAAARDTGAAHQQLAQSQGVIDQGFKARIAGETGRVGERARDAETNSALASQQMTDQAWEAATKPQGLQRIARAEYEARRLAEEQVPPPRLVKKAQVTAGEGTGAPSPAVEGKGAPFRGPAQADQLTAPLPEPITPEQIQAEARPLFNETGVLSATTNEYRALREKYGWQQVSEALKGIADYDQFGGAHYKLRGNGYEQVAPALKPPTEAKPAKSARGEGNAKSKATATPLLTAIRQAGGINPESGSDLARYFSNKESQSSGLITKNGRDVEDMVQHLREQGFELPGYGPIGRDTAGETYDTQTPNPFDSLSKAMQLELAGKPTANLSSEQYQRHLDEQIDREGALHGAGLDFVDQADGTILYRRALKNNEWLESFGKVIHEGTEPTKKDIASFRRISAKLGISGKAISRILASGKYGRSSESTEFPTGEEVDSGIVKGKPTGEGTDAAGKQVEDVAKETIADRLNGRLSGAVGELTDLRTGDKFAVSVRPDNSATGTYSVVTRNAEGKSQSFRMQYKGGETLENVRSHFEQYLNTDADGAPFKVSISARAPERPAPERAARPRATPDEQRLKFLRTQPRKTHGQEREIERLEAKARADPSKWKAGDGVGRKVFAGGRTAQINRGFRITEIDPESKLARITQVADTGITSTGGDNDRIGDEWVHLADLVRDNKYNAKSSLRPAENRPESARVTPKSESSPLSTSQVDRVREIENRLHEQDTPVEDFIRQRGFTPADELTEPEADLLRELAANRKKTRRAPDKSEQQGMFAEGISPTVESRAESQAREPKPGINFGLFAGKGEEAANRNIELGGREDDHPTIQKWRLDIHKGGKLSFGVDPERAVKGVTVRGYDVYRTTKDFVAWSKRLVDEMGDWVKPILKDVWTRVTALHQGSSYSSLEKVIEQKANERMAAPQLQKLLEGQGITPDEMKWTGFDDFIAGKKAKGEPVTKKEALEFARQNAVEVREVTKGEPSTLKLSGHYWSERQFQGNQRMYTLESNAASGERLGGVVGAPDEQRNVGYVFEGKDGRFDAEGGDASSRDGEELGTFDTLQEAQRAVESLSPEGGRLTIPAKPTKFEEWQIPGGENYRELLLTLPRRDDPVQADRAFTAYQKELRAKYGDDAVIMRDATPQEIKNLNDLGAPIRESRANAPDFKSSHFDEPNVLAHIRFNERTDAEGKKVLFIEEVQSDWHQEGRKKGYGHPSFDEAFEIRPRTANEFSRGVRDAFVAARRGETAVDYIRGTGDTPEAAREDAMHHPRLWDKWSNAIPDAPFKTTWPELAMKRAIRWGAENGFDKVAWTTGEQQAERYDLSKYLDSIDWAKNKDGSYDLVGFKDGKSVGFGGETMDVPASKLEDYVGKEIAQKIINGEGRKEGSAFMVSTSVDGGTLSGINLKVGGEGMKGFYDKILPSVASKLGKKFGAKVGETDIGGPPPAGFEHLPTTPPPSGKVHSLNITPSMRASVAIEGQPTFGSEPKFLADAAAKIREHEVRADLKQQISDNLKNSRGSGGPSTELLGLYTKLGASYLREGIVDLKEFARRLKEDLGEVRFRAMLDHVGGLPALWRQSNREMEAGRAGESKQALADVNAHYSNRQPRTEEGQFDGPPTPPVAPDQRPPTVASPPSSSGNIWERIQAEKKAASTRPQAEDRAAAAESQGEAARTTGINNVTVEQEREARSQAPIEKEARKSFGQMFENGKLSVDNDPSFRDKVRDWANNPKNLTDEQAAGLTYDRMRLSNEHKAVMDQVEAAQKAGDKSAETSARMALARVEDAINDNDVADTHGGTQTGRALSARRMMIKEDYSLDRLMQRARVAGAGEPAPELRDKLNEMTRRLAEQTERADEYEQKFSELAAKRAFRQLEAETRKQKRAATKTTLDADFADLKTQLIAARKEAKQVSPSGLAALDPEGKITPIILKMARNRVQAGANSAEGLVDSIYQAVKDHIEGVTKRDIRDAISGYGTAPKTRNQTVSDMARIRAELRKLSRQEDAPAAARVGQTDASKLKSYKTRLTTQLADLQARLNAGNFAKPSASKPLALDPEAQRLKADVGRTKNAIDLEIDRLRLARRGKIEKTADFAVKWARANLLSGVQTLGKLTTAGAMRNITTPMEELIGAGLSKVPGLRAAAAKAPREGGASLRAEARAASKVFTSYMDLFKPGVKSEMGHVLKTGKASIDVLYGKNRGADLPPEAIEMFGRIHGALKTPTKLAEFERALTKRLQWAARQGQDISDPAVQATHAAGAYADANRAIFLQDNPFVNAFRSATGALRRYEGPGQGAAKGMARMADVVFPIVKVPTNYVAEITSYVPGGGAAKAAWGLRKGTKNLTPDQADAIMRALKKQTVGIAFTALGYALANHIAGYYQGQAGEKQREGGQKPGDMTVLGMPVPHWAQHNPAFEALQIGASVKRVMDRYDRTGKSSPEAVGEAARVVAKGLAEQVPFFEEPVRVSEAIQSGTGIMRYLGELVRSRVIPPDVQRVASVLDPNEPTTVGTKARQIAGLQAPTPTKRYPQALAEVMEMGIPGLRKKVSDTKGGGGRSPYGRGEKYGGGGYGGGGYGKQY